MILHLWNIAEVVQRIPINSGPQTVNLLYLLYYDLSPPFPPSSSPIYPPTIAICFIYYP